MIKSFRNRGLKLFWETGNARRLSVRQIDRVEEILLVLDDAKKPSDMDVPGYVFHSLAPGQKGRYAVRVSGNYRVTFGFQEGNAVDVDLEDYH